jgi:hypothetical protein
MNAIPDIVSLMNEDDKREFIAFLRYKNKRNDAKALSCLNL